MNAKQSLRELRKYCDELEDFNRKSTATVRGLYSVIDALFTGKSVCESCIDFQECQLQAKEEGKGCEDFLLADITMDDVNGGDGDEGTGIHGASPEG